MSVNANHANETKRTSHICAPCRARYAAHSAATPHTSGRPHWRTARTRLAAGENHQTDGHCHSADRTTTSNTVLTSWRGGRATGSTRSSARPSSTRAALARPSHHRSDAGGSPSRPFASHEASTGLCPRASLWNPAPPSGQKAARYPHAPRSVRQHDRYSTIERTGGEAAR